MKKIISAVIAAIMTVSMVHPAVIAAGTTSAKSSFTDVGGNEYYAAAAEALSKINILAGYSDGSFGAGKSITRAEMAAIIVRMLGEENAANAAKGDTYFNDVDASHWASGYINVALRNGVISGDGSGYFRPNDDVTYEEAVKMIVCAVGLGDNIAVNPSDWSAGYLSVAENNGITRGQGGRKGNASTRGDVAVMVYNGLRKDLTVPKSSLKEATYGSSQNIKLTATPSDAVIYYTTNGTAPTTSSKKYTGEFTISQTTQVRAIAVIKDEIKSDEFKATYKIQTGSRRKRSSSASNKNTLYSLVFGPEINGIIDTTEEGYYFKDEYATLLAIPDDGYKFVRWESNNGGVFGSKTSPITTFKMPARNVVIKAIFEPDIESLITDAIIDMFDLDPEITDNDGDGIPDAIEIFVIGTDPKEVDTDGNGIADGDEDFDGDGLINIEEIISGTDITIADTDGDGLSDYEEVYKYQTDPIKSDTDDDKLTDYEEVTEYKTDPVKTDTDGDGLDDFEEIQRNLDPLKEKTDGKTKDSEVSYETNPTPEPIFVDEPVFEPEPTPTATPTPTPDELID